MSQGTGTVIYKDVELSIDYYYTKYQPAVWTLADGSPGYPAEGGDFDIEGIRLVGSDVELIELFTDEQLREMEEAYLEQNKE